MYDKFHEEEKEDRRQRRTIDKELDIIGCCKKCNRQLDMFDTFSYYDTKDSRCLICPKRSTAKFISHKDLDRIAKMKGK